MFLKPMSNFKREMSAIKSAASKEMREETPIESFIQGQSLSFNFSRFMEHLEDFCRGC